MNVGQGQGGSDWQELQELFTAARAVPPEDRDAFLDDACRGRPDLRQELADMLTAASDDQALRIESLFGALDVDRDPAAGQQLGPYRLLRLLGRGGMGAVYLAERADQQYEKKVAVKLLPPELAFGTARDRFLAERQILAQLEHPNIARLLDGGVTEGGTPYFVMEYVDGGPLDEYCDANRLSVDTRLDLFCEVCQAVQYAHSNLVVHRDLKPSNVLVDASGSVRLLDFGIAKVLSAGAAAVTVTRFGRPLTPSFASPEMLRGQPVNTATDVYALGVLLYDLLGGSKPQELDGLQEAEIVRVVCEIEPPLASSKLASREQGAAIRGEHQPDPEEVASKRNTTVHQLTNRLRGDLDTILAKALRKEPGERYPSVEQFEQDVRRYRKGLPIAARPPTLSYVAKKFVARHRAALAVGLLLAASLVAVAVVSVRFAVTTAGQARAIAKERDKSEEVRDFLSDLFMLADREQVEGKDLTGRQMLERAVVRLQGDEAVDPETRADILTTVAEVYTSLSMFKEAEPLYSEAMGLHRQLFGELSDEFADSLEELAYVHEVQGDWEAAEEKSAQALELRRELGDPAKTAASALILARLVHRRGDLDAAEPLYRGALDTLLGVYGEGHDEVAGALHSMGSWLEAKKRYAEAEALHRRGLEVRLKVLGESGRLVESYYNLGSTLRQQAKYEEARDAFGSALAINRRLMPEGHADNAFMLNGLAQVHKELGEWDEAEALYLEAMQVLSDYFGEGHPGHGIIRFYLGEMLVRKGELARAKPVLERALEILLAKAPEHAMVPATRTALGRCHFVTDEFEAAEELMLAGYDGSLEKLGGDDRQTRDAARYLSELYERWGNEGEADRWRELAADGSGP